MRQSKLFVDLTAAAISCLHRSVVPRLISTRLKKIASANEDKLNWLSLVTRSLTTSLLEPAREI